MLWACDSLKLVKHNVFVLRIRYFQLGMGMCTVFWRSSAKVPFVSRNYSVRSFYLTGVLLSRLSSFRGIKADVSVSNSVNVRFLCANYGSLYLLSSLSLVRLCGLLFLSASKIMPLCEGVEKSFLLQCYKVRYFQNAYILASELAGGLMQGLNVTYLIYLVTNKMRYLASQDKRCPSGMAIILKGRVKSGAGARAIASISALSIASFSSRILDIGYVSSCTTLGLVGIKVGITM